MRRNDFVIKLMSIVLFIAVAAYVGLYVFDKANKTLVTAPAVRFTVEECGSAEGFIIRSETVLTGSGSAVTLIAGEGEKLASGQAVAVHYEGESAMQRASEIRALQLQIKEAESDSSLSAEKNEDAKTGLLALSDAIQHKDLRNLEALTLSIKKTIFTNAAHTFSDAELSALKERLAGLLSENTGTSTVYAPVSGVFSAGIDGFEAIGPDMLTDDMTPSSLQALFGTSPNTDGTALGKLITGITWHYAAVLDASDARKLDGRISVAVQFIKTYNERLDMKIESIGAEENGQCVVVFSAKRGVSDMTNLRSLTAQVEFSAYSGLLVPMEAVYYESGDYGDKAYIYLLAGLQAEKVYVDILSENGDSFIVMDGTENSTVLREGSDIIVKGKDLYDGKVVGR